MEPKDPRRRKSIDLPPEFFQNLDLNQKQMRKCLSDGAEIYLKMKKGTRFRRIPKLLCLGGLMAVVILIFSLGDGIWDKNQEPKISRPPIHQTRSYSSPTPTNPNIPEVVRGGMTDVFIELVSPMVGLVVAVVAVVIWTGVYIWIRTQDWEDHRRAKDLEMEFNGLLDSIMGKIRNLSTEDLRQDTRNLLQDTFKNIQQLQERKLEPGSVSEWIQDFTVQGQKILQNMEKLNELGRNQD